MIYSKEVLKRFENTEPATYGHFPGVCFMDASIKPVDNRVRMAGLAYTVRLQGKDSAQLYLAIKRAPENSVLVIDRCGDNTFAAVGEMVARNAKAHHLAGIVVDGAATDSLALLEMDFPVFCRSISVATTNVWGVSGESDLLIQCGGAPVQPGDLILGNADGVVVISNQNFLELLEKAESVEAREKIMRVKFEQGLDQLLDVTPLLEADLLNEINRLKELGRMQ